MKITRRKFLKQIGIGAAAAVMAPSVLVAAAEKAPAAAYPNPLFTGALGQYDGVHIYEDKLSLSQIEDAQRWGSAWSKIKPVKIDGTDYYVCTAERIPFDELYRPGGRQSKRRG